MKLYDFLNLSDVEKYDAVWFSGVHVGSHIKDNIAIYLYLINDFYCEVYYDMKTDKILYNKTFKQAETIDEYHDNIKI